MTAEEIRGLRQVYSNGLNPPLPEAAKDSITLATVAIAAIEIAAQLAELNHRLARISSGKEELAVLATIQHP